MSAHRLSLENIERSARVIDPVFTGTPQYNCEPLSQTLGADVVLKVEGENIAFNAHVISRKENSDPAAILKLNLETSVVEENKPFVINDIYYSTSSTSISEESKLILIQFADYLKVHSSWIIEIRGHTDNIGDDKSNEALSLGRANQVKDFLVSNGVKVEQLSAKGFGESKPVASNDTESGRAKNRRTEFVIKKL
jgi:outer membrane protein OmpA-like peptidoglycan-associated protein